MKILTGHKGWVNCLENVGNEIWSGSADRTLRVWNIAEQSCIQKIEGFRGWMYCVASLGKVLWASCSDQKIRVYGITEVKKVAIAEDTVEPRQRGISMSRPRSSTINKKKCVDASSQTTGRVIVVDEGMQVKVRNAEGEDKAEVLSAELLKQIEASGDIENLLKYGLKKISPLLLYSLLIYAMNLFVAPRWINYRRSAVAVVKTNMMTTIFRICPSLICLTLKTF